jgi:hypothetical protein
MSAPLELTAEQLRSLADALERMSAITQETGVNFASYSDLHAEIGDSSLQVWWDGERYIVRDRNGD